MSGQTRRDWVLSIGQVAVGAGVAWPIMGAPATSMALPPGVYLPSRNDLAHALMSADRYHPIPPGCPTDYIRPRTGPYQPLFLTSAEFTVTSCLARLLLGEASQPAGEDAAEWIDLCLASEPGVRDAEARVGPGYKALAIAYFGSSREPASQASRQSFRDGLNWLSNSAKSRYGGDFLSLRPEQQIEILHSISDDRGQTSEENAGTRLFGYLKSEVIRAYYTSRAGLDELDFKGNAFYAQSPGCTTK